MLKGLRFFGRVAAALGALGCLAAAVIGQGGRWSAKIDILNHFAPLWLLGGLIAVGLALLLARGRERQVVIGVAAASLLLTGSRVLPEVAARLAPGAKPQGEQLKVIQFNAYMYNVAPTKSVDWLLAQNADIVIIEEGEGLPRGEVLRLRARYPYCNGCPDEGWWTNMILAKQSAVAQGRFELPKPDSNFPILGGWSRFAGPGGDFTVIGVHMNWPWRWMSPPQRAALAEFANRGPKDRLIVAGDFNMTAWSFGLHDFDRAMGMRRVTHGQASWPGEAYYRAPSLPTLPFPYLPIDQVYAGDGWRRVSVKRGPRIGSDHYPIVVELAAAKPK